MEVIHKWHLFTYLSGPPALLFVFIDSTLLSVKQFLSITELFLSFL